MTAFKLHTPARKILATLTFLLLVDCTLAFSLMVKPFGAVLQDGAYGVPSVPRADQVVNFASNEIVQGSGRAWSLKFAANPADTLQLVVNLPGFGGVMLFRDIDYSLSGRAVTTFKSFPEGTVRAWYRY